MGNKQSSDTNKLSIVTSKKSSASTRSSRSSLSGPSKKPLLTATQRGIVKYCLENAKEDMSERIIRRVGEKKDDYKIFMDSLPKEEKTELIENLRDFLILIGNTLMDSELIQKISIEYGIRHVNLRNKGFKPDFFAGTADAVTTECTFLDGATHPPSETAGAWSELSTFVFSNVRDGYYLELRKQRKSSNAFSSKVKLSEMAQESKDEQDRRRRSQSSCGGSGESTEERSSKEGTPQFLLPPTVY